MWMSGWGRLRTNAHAIVIAWGELSEENGSKKIDRKGIDHDQRDVLKLRIGAPWVNFI